MKMKMNNNVMTNVITALRRNRVILNVWRFLRPTFLKILFLTLKKVLRREGISAAGEATMPEFQRTMGQTVEPEDGKSGRDC